jgi:hypothetical protein
MSETLDPVAMELDQRQLAEQLLAQAKEQGVELVGPNGLLNQLTKNVLETALKHPRFDAHLVTCDRCAFRRGVERSTRPRLPRADGARAGA